jgi:hypothetical protein
MDTSNSSPQVPSVVGRITGKQVETIPPVSPEDFAQLLFEAVDLLKPRLEYLHGFHHPFESEDSWKLGARMLRSVFGSTKTRIQCVCWFSNWHYEEKGGYRFYLTQKGEWRVIQRCDDGRLLATAIEEPADFVPFLSMRVDYCQLHVAPYERGKVPSSIGLWVLQGLQKVVGNTVFTAEARVKPMREILRNLNDWHANASNGVGPSRLQL